MAKTLSTSTRPTRLSEILAGQPEWSLADRLLIIRRLAVKVQALHRNGQTHRAVDAEHVSLDDELQPELASSPAVRSFGGDDSDPDFCPMELAGGDALQLPVDIEAAAAALNNAGHSLNPRHIDIYQLGTLLCQLLTDESVLGYLYSAKTKAKVPTVAQPLLETALGCDASNRFDDCEQLIAALDQAVQQTQEEGPGLCRKTPGGELYDGLPRPSKEEKADGATALEGHRTNLPTEPGDTPSEGSVLLPSRDTPPDGHASPAPSSAESQPPDGPQFERLAHFRILEQIGSGGMGDVYRAYDESLKRQVAIKVLPPELARDEDFVRRFHAEATAAGKLNHPNVVRVYLTDEDAGNHFFAMQFIEGESLEQWLDRRPRMSLEESLETVEQCLAGLAAAHAHGLVHRDIKPGNVLLDRRTGNAVLADFGLVHRMGTGERMTATGTVMGTVDYIAPEQARGQEVDGRADIYSLGALWYQLVSGRLPFQAESPTAMLFQHAYEEPFPLEQAAPDTPQPIIDIIGCMMAKSPADRYPGCIEVLADLRAYREGRPVAGAQRIAAGTRQTTILPAADPLEDIPLPDDLEQLAGQSRWQRARDWAATMFRRHTPEFVQDLQSTTQQVDGAVAHYERRCSRLAELQEEARSIAADLAEQLETNVEAVAAATQMVESAESEHEEQAALAKKRECEEQVEALRKQHDEQRQQIDEFENQLGQADAKLAQLRSQRDVLKARLRSAEARQQLHGGRYRAKRTRRVLAGLVATSLLVLGIGVALLLWNALHVPKSELATSPLPAPQSEPATSPSSVRKPELAIFPFDARQARTHQEEWAEHLGVPVEFTNSIGMKFRLIPPGEFMMGSPEVELQRALEGAKAANNQPSIDKILSEGPQHRVRITKPFYLGKYEVTQSEWEAVMGYNRSQFEDPMNPVETVTWGDIQLFLAKLNAAVVNEGMRFTLPTEAQWEYVCRAGTTAAYCFGEDTAVIGQYGWYRDNSGGKTHPVGEKSPNGWDLYDMYGNVWEWCADGYSNVFYDQSPLDDPVGPEAGAHRVIRGGGLDNPACRSASRNHFRPGARNENLGFRVALVIPDDVRARSLKEDLDRRGAERVPTAEVLRHRAEAHVQKSDFDQAITVYDEAIRLHPEVAEFFRYRAEAYARKGHFDQAISDCTEAIRLDPNDAFAYAERGFAYAEPGELDKADADRKEALRIRPNCAQVYFQRGESLRRKKQRGLAIAEFSRAIWLDQQHALSYRERGKQYHQLGQLGQALEDFDKAVELTPNADDARRWRGKTYAALEQMDRALADFTVAVEQNPRNRLAYSERAEVYLSLGQPESALADYRTALAVNPGRDDSYFLHTQIYTRCAEIQFFDLKTYDAALADYEMALKLRPNSAGGQGDVDLWMARLKQRGAPSTEPAPLRQPLPNGWVIHDPVNVGPAVNSSVDDCHPTLTADGLILVLASDRPGGLGKRDLWICKRANLDEPFDTPVNLGPAVNSEFYETAPTISADGLTLLFASGRLGGQGSLDIWTCTRPALDAPFGQAVNLGLPVNSRFGETSPTLSADVLTLVFNSNRPDGYGNADLWISTRAQVNEPFGEPVNVGPVVNSSFEEWRPALSADALTLLFASNRPDGEGDSDLWMCTRQSTSEPFCEPVNLGRSVNGRMEEYDPFLSADGLELYFQTNRPGGEGTFDLWKARIEHRDVPSTEEISGTIDDIPGEPAPPPKDATQSQE